MKKIIITIVLLGSILRGMDKASPADIIRSFAKSPNVAREELQKLFSNDALAKFRDEKYNNLIHIAVQQLTDHTGCMDYETMRTGYTDLVRCLVKSGVNINEQNDESDTPLIVMYRARETDLEFTDFLEDELKAKITYFSPDPEIRMLKKRAGEIVSYCCPCLGKRKQN